MALRTKEDLQKLYAANRERLERKKIKEQERERIREEKEKEYWSGEKGLKRRKRLDKAWVKMFLNSIKDDPDWMDHWLDEIDDIAIHSLQILEVLWDKNELNENEDAVKRFAFHLLHPNDL